MTSKKLMAMTAFAALCLVSPALADEPIVRINGDMPPDIRALIFEMEA